MNIFLQTERKYPQILVPFNKKLWVYKIQRFGVMVDFFLQKSDKMWDCIISWQQKTCRFTVSSDLVRFCWPHKWLPQEIARQCPSHQSLCSMSHDGHDNCTNPNLLLSTHVSLYTAAALYTLTVLSDKFLPSNRRSWPHFIKWRPCWHDECTLLYTPSCLWHTFSDSLRCLETLLGCFCLLVRLFSFNPFPVERPNSISSKVHSVHTQSCWSYWSRTDTYH